MQNRLTSLIAMIVVIALVVLIEEIYGEDITGWWRRRKIRSSKKRLDRLFKRIDRRVRQITKK